MRNFLIALVLLVVFSVSSCNGIDKATNENKSNKKIVNYFKEDEKSIDEIYEANYMHSINNKNYIIGLSMEDISDNDIINIYNQTTEENKELKIPKELINATVVDKINEKIYIRAVSLDDKLQLFEVDDKGEFKKILEKKMGVDSFSCFDVNSYGEFFCISQNHGENSCYLEEYNADGENLNSISLNEKISEMNNAYIPFIKFSKEGDLYLFKQTVDATNETEYSEIYILDSSFNYKGKLEDTFIKGIQNVISSKDGIYIVSKTEDNIFLIDKLDTITNQITESHELENVESIYNGDENYDCMYIKDNTLYGYIFDTMEEFKIHNIDFLDSYISFIGLSGENITYSYKKSMAMNSKTCFVLNENNEMINSFALNSIQGGNISNYMVNADSTISYLEYFDSYSVYVNTVTENGELLSSIKLNDISSDMIGIDDINRDEKDNIILSINIKSINSEESSTQVCVFDQKGELLSKIEDPTIKKVNSIIKLKNNDICVFFESGIGLAHAKVDFESNTINKNYKIEGFIAKDYFKVVQGNGIYDFFISEFNELYGYNLENKKTTSIVNYNESDIDGRISAFSVINNDNILFKIFKPEYSTEKIRQYKRVDEETLKKIQNKIEITISGNVGIKDDIAEFNKSNDKYKVKIIESDYFDNLNNYDNIDKMLSSTSIPDIVCVTPEINMNRYIEKNLFIDLYEFINTDDEFKKDDYIKNIFELFEKEKKLYQLTPMVSFSTIVGRSSDVGNDLGWNIDEFQKFEQKYSNKNIFGEITKENLLDSLLSLSLNYFVNYDKGECYFEKPEFIELIEAVKNYGVDDIAYSDYNVDNKDYTQQLLFIEKIYRYDLFHSLEKGILGEELTFKGYPSESKNLSAMDYYFSFCISKKSNKKQESWEFIKTFFNEDYQYNIIKDINYMPVKKSSLEKMAGICKNPMENIDCWDVIHASISPNFQNTNGEFIFIDYIDDVGIEKMNSLIENTKSIVNNDFYINKIIKEELMQFYSDDKTAQEVSKIIQNRVSTYINE